MFPCFSLKWSSVKCSFQSCPCIFILLLDMFKVLLPSLPSCFYFFSFCYVNRCYGNDPARTIQNFFSPLDFLDPCITGFRCGSAQRKQMEHRLLVWGPRRTGVQISHRTETPKWFWQSWLARRWYAVWSATICNGRQNGRILSGVTFWDTAEFVNHSCISTKRHAKGQKCT